MSSRASDSGPTGPGRHALKRNAFGTAGIVFFVVAAASPLAATVGAGPVVFGSTGVGGAGAYVLAALVLLLFAVGYAAMGRHMASAGGFAAYASRGLGRPWGFATSFVALLAYNCMLAGVLGQFAAFAHEIMAAKLGLDLPWQAWAAIGLAVIAVLGYHDVSVSARFLGVLMLVEVGVLAVLGIAIVVQGGDSGLSLAPFAPSNVFAGAAGVGLLFAFASFIGFEATAVYGEEARDPKRTVPRATYTAILLIGGFYAFTMWALAIGYGTDSVQDAATANPVGFVLDLSDRYLGSFTTDVMNYLVLTSLFATMAAFQHVLARYLYSLGRIGVLPRALGRTHGTHRSPHVASLVQSAITTAIVAVFAIAGADPFADLFAWLVGLGALSVLTLQAVASIAVLGFFRRTQVDRRVWNTLVAPILGLAGLLGAIYLALANFDALTGVTSGPVTYLPWLVPVAALVGLAAWARMSDRTVGIGDALTDDPVPAETVAPG